MSLVEIVVDVDGIHGNACLAQDTGMVDYVVVPAQGSMSPFLSSVRNALINYKYHGADAVAAGVSVQKLALRLADVLEKHGAQTRSSTTRSISKAASLKHWSTFRFDRFRFLALSFEVDDTFVDLLSGLLRRNGYVATRNRFNVDCPWERA